MIGTELICIQNTLPWTQWHGLQPRVYTRNGEKNEMTAGFATHLPTDDIFSLLTALTTPSKWIQLHLVSRKGTALIHKTALQTAPMPFPVWKIK
jgi:hypothetical protein